MYLEVLEMLCVDMLLLHSLLLLLVVVVVMLLLLLLQLLLEAQVTWLQLLQDPVLLTARLRLHGGLPRGRRGSWRHTSRYQKGSFMLQDE